MLNDIRKNVAHPYIKTLLGLIIFVFIFFFGWSMKSSQNSSPSPVAGALALVNDQPVTPNDYRQAYNGLLDFYRRISQGTLTTEQAQALGLDKRALDLVIDRMILFQEANKLGFSVSDDEVKAAIAALPIFKEGNAFSGARYHQVLQAQGMAPEQYEAAKRQELLIGKVEERLRSGASVSDADVESEYRDRATHMTVDYVLFPADEQASRVVVTEQRLQDYLKAHADEFRAEEKRSARFLFFPVDDYASQVKISDEDLRQEFKGRAIQFQLPESVRLRQILVRVEPGASEAAVKKAQARATELRAKATGASFADVARRESDDDATKSAGGEMGWVGRGVLADSFDKVIFSLAEGDVSQPVRSEMGYHLFQAVERRAAKDRTFEEARADLLRVLQRERARESALKAADAVLMDLEDKKATWDSLPGGRKATTTALVAKNQPDPSVPNQPKFREALFSLTETSPGALAETAEGTFLVSVSRKRPAGAPPLSEIRAAVEAAFRAAESKNLAKSAAETFASEAQRSGWASAIASRRLKGATSESFNNKGASIPPLGGSEEAKKALFEKPETGRVLPVAYDVGGAYAALRIASVSLPDMAGLAAEREKIQKDLLPTKREATFEAEMEKLRKAAKIEILDPTLREEKAPQTAAN